jgi:hypothetical protein
VLSNVESFFTLRAIEMTLLERYQCDKEAFRVEAMKAVGAFGVAFGRIAQLVDVAFSNDFLASREADCEIVAFLAHLDHILFRFGKLASRVSKGELQFGDGELKLGVIETLRDLNHGPERREGVLHCHKELGLRLIERYPEGSDLSGIGFSLLMNGCGQ